MKDEAITGKIASLLFFVISCINDLDKIIDVLATDLIYQLIIVFKNVNQ